MQFSQQGFSGVPMDVTVLWSELEHFIYILHYHSIGDTYLSLHIFSWIIAASWKKHSSITTQRATATYVHTKYTNTIAIPLLQWQNILSTVCILYKINLTNPQITLTSFMCEDRGKTKSCINYLWSFAIFSARALWRTNGCNSALTRIFQLQHVSPMAKTRTWSIHLNQSATISIRQLR